MNFNIYPTHQLKNASIEDEQKPKSKRKTRKFIVNIDTENYILRVHAFKLCMKLLDVFMVFHRF